MQQYRRTCALYDWRADASREKIDRARNGPVSTIRVSVWDQDAPLIRHPATSESIAVLLLIMPFVCALNTVAQKSVMTVEANASACEVNAASFDNLANELRSNKERIFIIARLGKGELSPNSNRRRLSNVRTYFLTNWKIDPARFTFCGGIES